MLVATKMDLPEHSKPEVTSMSIVQVKCTERIAMEII